MGYPQFSKNNDHANNPKLIDTLSFSGFTANSANQFIYIGVLKRGAKRRFLSIQNALNQNISVVTFYPFESLSVPRQGINLESITLSSNGIASGFEGVFGSENFTGLKEPCDSFMIGLQMGATAPLSGNVYIYMTEVI
jgi:hypothetical protein